MGCFHYIWRHSMASQTVAESYCVTVGSQSASFILLFLKSSALTLLIVVG